jgi:hypothetical protein
MTTKTTYTTVPAQPGWFTARLIRGSDGGYMLGLDPIVAWEIKREEETACLGEMLVSRSVEPLTIDIEGEFSRYDAIKRPDGTFEMPHDGRVFHNATEALLFLRDEEEAKAEKAQKRSKVTVTPISMGMAYPLLEFRGGVR